MGLSEHQLSEEAVERGVKVGGLAGMGARRLEGRAAHRREPTETLVWVKSGYLTAAAIVIGCGATGSYAFKRGKLPA